MGGEASVPEVTPELLTRLVRQALRRERARALDWQAVPLTGGLGAALGANRLYRVVGSARDGAAAVLWVFVLKLLPRTAAAASGPADAPAETWDREARLYASGILADLPAGLAAPRCFAVVEQGAVVQLWLEEVRDTIGPRWPLARFGLAARHLGRFNGAWLDGRPLPDAPWLGPDLVPSRADRTSAIWARIDQWRDHPLCRLGWPADVAAQGRRLFAERHAFLAALDRLPRVLRHGDADRRNLFARDRPGAEPQTVAIDWALASVGPVGADLGPLIAGSVLWSQGVAPDDLPALDRVCFAGYLEGLGDTGWRGDPRLVRLGFIASMALQFGPLHGLLTTLEAPPARRAGIERAFGRPLEEVLGRYAEIQRFLYQRAEEARGLLAAVP